MDRPIENLAPPSSLESIEQSIKHLNGVLTGRKVQATAQNEARALFKGLANNLEQICNNNIANSDTLSLETLKKHYNKIDTIYTMLHEVGEQLSVDTNSVAQQVHALFFLVESRGEKRAL